MVSRRHSDSRGRRRRHRSGDARSGPERVLAIAVRCAEYPSFSPDGTQIAFDAPAEDALGNQTAIMAANTDGTNIRTLSTVPFRQSVHPTWQPA